MSIWTEWKEWSKLRKQEMQIQSLAVGLNSTVDVKRDLHIVFLDYDLKDVSIVEESVKEVQEFWKIGDAYIIATKNGFHAYFFTTIVPYERLRMIINYAAHVDLMFKYIARYYDHKTIRVAGKYQERDLKFVKIIKSKYNKPSDLGTLKRQEFEALSGVSLSTTT